MMGRARIRQRAVNSSTGAYARPRPVLAQGADCGHDDLRYFLGVGDHDNVRSPFDLGYRRTHPVVAEAVDAGVNTPVGGRKHRPGRTATPRRGRRSLGERNTGEGALGDRVERGVIGRDVGAE